EVMAIVRSHERNAAFAREPHQIAIHGLVDIEALILHFEEEITFAENVTQAVSGVARVVKAAVEERLGNRATQARGKRDESAAVLGEQVVVNARLVVEAFQEA